MNPTTYSLRCSSYCVIWRRLTTYALHYGKCSNYQNSCRQCEGSFSVTSLSLAMSRRLLRAAACDVGMVTDGL
eukprot:COSAG02_NODE_682_length_18523_cov_28.592271_3_plen_73_part_00